MACYPQINMQTTTVAHRMTAQEVRTGGSAAILPGVIPPIATISLATNDVTLQGAVRNQRNHGQAGAREHTWR